MKYQKHGFQESFTEPVLAAFSPIHRTHLCPSFILPPHPFISLSFAVCVISWTLHFSFHSSMRLWSSPCECGPCQGSESWGPKLNCNIMVNTHLCNCFDLWSHRPGVVPGGDNRLSNITQAEPTLIWYLLEYYLKHMDFGHAQGNLWT